MAKWPIMGYKMVQLPILKGIIVKFIGGNFGKFSSVLKTGILVEIFRKKKFEKPLDHF